LSPLPERFGKGEGTFGRLPLKKKSGGTCRGPRVEGKEARLIRSNIHASSKERTASNASAPEKREGNNKEVVKRREKKSVT